MQGRRVAYRPVAKFHLIIGLSCLENRYRHILVKKIIRFRCGCVCRSSSLL